MQSQNDVARNQMLLRFSHAMLTALVTLCLLFPSFCASALAVEMESMGSTLTAFGMEIGQSETHLRITSKVRDVDALCDLLDWMPNLTQVDVYESFFKRAEMAMLSERYPHIRFGWTLQIGDHLVRTDAEAFSTLHRSSSKVHRSADFELLKYCWQLEALDIGHNAVHDLSFLQYLPNLKVLILACNSISDIEMLRHLPKLEYLELFDNTISDISPLADLTNLIDLNICFNRLPTADAYEPLKGLKSLRRLWLFNSNVYGVQNPIPEEVTAALREALPDCHINTTSYSTAGGWRENPRYTTIAQIFKINQYLPFTYFK